MTQAQVTDIRIAPHNKHNLPQKLMINGPEKYRKFPPITPWVKYNENEIFPRKFRTPS